MSSGAEIVEIYSGSEIGVRKDRHRMRHQPIRNEDSQTFEKPIEVEEVDSDTQKNIPNFLTKTFDIVDVRDSSFLTYLFRTLVTRRLSFGILQALASW